MKTAKPSVATSYRPDIDGLRAVAILSVLIYHAFPETLPGGYIGVDVFFVISGFLISGIILQKLERGSFSYLDFYVRRVKRLFPSLILVLSAVMALGWFTLFEDEYMALGKHIAAGAGFLSNFVLLREGGYFDVSADMKPLLHLWSLAIEEHFSLVWPLLLAVAWRRPRAIFALIAGVLVFSFASNVWLIGTRPSHAFYVSFTRFWELMIGSSLAYMTSSRVKAASLVVRFREWFAASAEQKRDLLMNLASCAGMGLILFALALLDKDDLFPGWWAVLPTVGTFLVIAAGPGAFLNRTLLSFRGMVFIGLISYPLYLWHWPVLYFVRVVGGGEPAFAARCGIVVVSITLAWLSYRYVEQTVNRMQTQALRTAAALCCLMVLVAVSGVMAYKTMFPTRFPESWQQIARARYDRSSPRSWDQSRRLKPYFIGDPAQPEILFLGDSHMETYSPRIKRVMEEFCPVEKGVALATAGGCPPLPGVERLDAVVPLGIDDFFRQGIAFAREKKVKKLVLCAYWDGYLVGLLHGGTQGPILYASDDPRKRPIRPGTPEFRRLFDQLESVLAPLAAQGTRIYLVLPNPVSRIFDPNSILAGFDRLRLGAWPPVREQQVARAEVERRRAPATTALREMSARLGITLIDPVPHISGTTACSNIEDGRSKYTDDNHLTARFVRDHASYIDAVFDFRSADKGKTTHGTP